MLFGGRIAEEMFMNQMTTGASNDFERATQMARDMVTRYGMSDVLGPMVYAENEGEVFLGRSITKTTNVSEETMRKVDGEIRRIIDEQYALARKLIEDNRDKVETMAKALLEWETIDAEQIDDIMAGQAAAAAEVDGQRAAGLGRTSVQRRRRRRGAACLSARHADSTMGRSSGPFSLSASMPAHATSIDSAHSGTAAASDCALDRPLVMGIVNVTPDSFSDGGRFAAPDAALAQARRLHRRGRRHPRHRRRIDAAGRRRRSGRGGTAARDAAASRPLPGAAYRCRSTPASPR